MNDWGNFERTGIHYLSIAKNVTFCLFVFAVQNVSLHKKGAAPYLLGLNPQADLNLTWLKHEFVVFIYLKI